jgi:hypothetical protein
LHPRGSAMTIVYVHGVKVRNPGHGIRLGKSFGRWVGPKIAVNGSAADYVPVYWGDVGAKFRWDLAVRPLTALLKAGGDSAFPGLGSLREASAKSPLDRPPPQPTDDGPVLRAQPSISQPSAPPLSSIPRDKRPDFLADLYLAVRPRKDARDPIAEEPFFAALADACASVAAEWDRLITAEQTESARAARLMQAVEARLADDNLLQQGGFEDWMTKAGETLKRAAFWPADAVSTVFAELRPATNDFVAHFLGDVLAYLHERDNSAGPGPISTRVLSALKQAHSRKKTTGERIIVVTHSMGGQLLYDALTFTQDDADLADLEIDHWISCGAQVAFFAELRLLRGQPDVAKPQKLELPNAVKSWTNYYDRNDLVGFIMGPVFNGVQDLEYDTGYGLAFAHTGYLARPSFFEAVAARIAST